MSKVVIGKTLSLRPTEEQKTNLEVYMKKHSITKPSEALKQILNDELPKLDKEGVSQLEPTPLSFRKPSLSKEKASGKYVLCPLRALPVKLLNRTVKWKPPVDTSVCPTCKKYPCESWKDMDSWKRTEPRPTT